MHAVMSLVHSLQQSISHITGCAKTSDREVNVCSIISNQNVMVAISEYSESLIRKMTNGQDPILSHPPSPPQHSQTFPLILSSYPHWIPWWSLSLTHNNALGKPISFFFFSFLIFKPSLSYPYWFKFSCKLWRCYQSFITNWCTRELL